MGLITRGMLDADQQAYGKGDPTALDDMYGKLQALKEIAETRLAAQNRAATAIPAQ